MDRYELVDGKSSKFWAVKVEGNTLTVNFGRLGAQGQNKEKVFANGEQAALEKNKLVAEKTKKGYALVQSGALASSPRSQAPASAAKDGGQVSQGSPVAALPAQAITSTAITSPAITSPAITSPAAASTLVAKEAQSGAAPIDPAPTQSIARGGEIDLMAHITGALPTRSHPQGSFDGPGQWLSFTADLATAIEKTRKEADNNYMDKATRALWLEGLDWFASHIGQRGQEREPQRLNVAEALTLTSKTMMVISANRDFAGMEPYMHWLLSKVCPETFVQAARLPLEIDRPNNGLLRWKVLKKAIYALRSALVKAPEPYYESVLALIQKDCTEHQSSDFEWVVHWTYILADDRPGVHPLKPLSVIESAQPIERLPQKDRALLVPLALQAPPQSVLRLLGQLKYEECAALYASETKLEAAQTAVAAAMHFGQSAVATIKWLLSSDAAAITPLIPLIFALEDRDALSLLLPHMHERSVKAQLDAVSREYPAAVFRKLMGAVAAGSEDLNLLARVLETIRTGSPLELARWVEGDAKALAFIERERRALSRAVAAIEDCPPVLRNPPWLVKSASPSIPKLSLPAISTPFVFSPALLPRSEGEGESAPYHPPIEDVIGAVLHYLRSKTPFLPSRIEPGIDARKIEQFNKSIEWSLDNLRGYTDIFHSLFEGSEPEEDALLFLLWRDCPGGWNLEQSRPILFPKLIERYGEQVMPALTRLFSISADNALSLIESIDSSAIAPLVAKAMIKTVKARAPAMAWLARYRRTAVLRLIPDALAGNGPVNKAAINALRAIAYETEGGRQAINSLAKLYAKDEPRVAGALDHLLDTDPLYLFPPKSPKLPSWFDPSALMPPALLSGAALPNAAISTLAQILALGSPDGPYPGIDQVRRAATGESLAAFSWDLFSSWLSHEAPVKDIWAMRALGWLGDDEVATKLSALIRKWPGQAAHARAVAGLDTLADIGSDAALMQLASIAEKVKFKGLQERAREKIAAVAQGRGLTAEELADRLAPDLDLDEKGGLDLDFGARRFRVGFDQFLKPVIRDAADIMGKPLKDLPKPNKSDDEKLAGQASEKYKALKRDVKAIASLQITRLENMLVAQRRLAPEVFWVFFASHPLMRNLAARLVWGWYESDDPRCAPASAFRVTEDLSLADQGDESIEIDFGAQAKGRIGLVHPMNPPAGGFEAWGNLFGDYEISQPFAQIGREVYALTEEEKASTVIKRFMGMQVESARIRGILAYGWKLGEPQDAGAIHWVEKKALVGGVVKLAQIDCACGWLMPGAQYEEAPTLGELSEKKSRMVGRRKTNPLRLARPRDGERNPAWAYTGVFEVGQVIKPS